MITVFTLVQLRRVVVLDGARLGQCGVVPVIRRPCSKRLPTLFACK